MVYQLQVLSDWITGLWASHLQSKARGIFAFSGANIIVLCEMVETCGWFKCTSGFFVSNDVILVVISLSLSLS